MAPGVIKQALEQKPFRPVRVYTGDGGVFEIKSREFCFLSPKGRTLVIFSREGDRYGDDEDMRLVDVFLITKVETQGNSESFKFAPDPGGEKDK